MDLRLVGMSAPVIPMIFNTGLLLILVVRLAAKGLSSRYRVMFAYVVFEALSVLMSDLIILFFGLESAVYRTHYYTYSTLTPAFQVWVLLDLAGRAFRVGGEDSYTTRLLAVAALVVGFPIFVFIGFLPVDGLDRFQAGSLVFQMVITLLIYLYLLERRDIDPGRNLRAMLGGMALMVSCQAMNFISFLQNRIDFAVFQFVVPTVYGIALLIFTVGLWNYQPAAASAHHRVLNLGLQRSLRVMLNLLQHRQSSQ